MVFLLCVTQGSSVKKNIKKLRVLSLLVSWASVTQYILTAVEQDFHWIVSCWSLCLFFDMGGM